MARSWQADDIELAMHLIAVEGKPNKTVALVLNCTEGELKALLYARGLMDGIRTAMAGRSKERMCLRKSS